MTAENEDWRWNGIGGAMEWNMRWIWEGTSKWHCRNIGCCYVITVGSYSACVLYSAARLQ